MFHDHEFEYDGSGELNMEPYRIDADHEEAFHYQHQHHSLPPFDPIEEFGQDPRQRHFEMMNQHFQELQEHPHHPHHHPSAESSSSMQQVVEMNDYEAAQHALEQLFAESSSLNNDRPILTQAAQRRRQIEIELLR